MSEKVSAEMVRLLREICRESAEIRKDSDVHVPVRTSIDSDLQIVLSSSSVAGLIVIVRIVTCLKMSKLSDRTRLKVWHFTFKQDTLMQFFDNQRI